MSDTVNGYKIHAQFNTLADGVARAGRIILVDRGPSFIGRWVCSWQGAGDDEWSGGYYFDHFVDARSHFLARCAKEVWRE